jgi:predicted amidohydrolase YtcJ
MSRDGISSGQARRLHHIRTLRFSRGSNSVGFWLLAPDKLQRRHFAISQKGSPTVKKLTLAVVIFAGIMSFTAARGLNDGQPADLLLRGGKIVTVDERCPEAECIAVRGDQIVAVGSEDELKKWIGPQTKVIELGNKLAIPGFIEGHGHFVSLGQSRMMLDLKRAKSWDEIIDQVAEAARKAEAGEWIIGRGWHQEKWVTRPESNVDGYPTHERLSSLTPKNPVLLTHASGHMSFANAEAMRLAEVDSSTQDPPGGEVLRDRQHNPIGVFRETAQALVNRAMNADRAGHESDRRGDTKQRLRRAVDLATTECLAHGVTSFQDAGSSFGTIDLLKELAESNDLKIRLWVMVRDSNEALSARLGDYRMIGAGDNHLTVRAIKRSIDGALGPHGAWLLEPYEDMPESSGLNTSSIESIRETANLALKHDFQLCVHAIGDRANREVLNLFEAAFRRRPAASSLRWRIEHAQHLHPDDIPRFARLGVVASMQGVHCTSDAVYVIERLGSKRARDGAYVWRSLLKSGAIVTNGTDVPVEDLSPIESFYATVTRRLADGTAFYPDQRMTRAEALRSYTLSGAYAAFEEDLKGSLTPGKLADITVLSQDIMSIPDEEILKTEVVLTIVGGRVLYERPVLGRR